MTVSVRDEYAPRFGRQTLTLWSGSFASDLEGSAWELPDHGGFMVTLEFGRGSVRVECEAPRTEDNYMEVDRAIVDAVDRLLDPPVCPWSILPSVSRPWWACTPCAGAIVETAYGEVCTAHRDAFEAVQ